MTTIFRVSRAAATATYGRVSVRSAAGTAASVPIRRWLSDEAGSDEGPPHLTGSVKFYLRNKAYGFITADDSSLGDIFVHGRDIDSADRRGPGGTTGEGVNVYHPFLLTGERVSFAVAEDVETPQGTMQTQARLVRYEDGAEVPKFRTQNVKRMVERRVERAKNTIGHAVFNMMTTDGEDNVEHVGRRVVELYGREMEGIRRAEELQKQQLENLGGGSEEKGEEEPSEEKGEEEPSEEKGKEQP